MLNLPEKLSKMEKSGEIIRVAVVGVGQMGAGVATLTSRMKGMDVLVIADIDREKAMGIFQEMGISKDKIFLSDDPDKCNRALEKGMRVVTSDAKIVPHINSIDVLVTELQPYAPAGLPAITVPAGYDENGQPFAVTMIADFLGEPALISAAYAYEQQTKARVEPDLPRIIQEIEQRIQ